MNDATVDTWRANRDAKAAQLLEPHTPAWLLNEEVDEERQQIRFDLVHRWPVAGWARLRYTYEADVDVLHFRGAAPISTAERSRLKPEDRFDTRVQAGKIA